MHVDLQGLLRRRRRPLAPDRVDQPVARDHFAGVAGAALRAVRAASARRVGAGVRRRGPRSARARGTRWTPHQQRQADLKPRSRQCHSMFGEAYTIEDSAGTVRLMVRGTEVGVEPRALVLEVLLTGAAEHAWADALTSFEKRFELLHGAVEVNGERLEPGAERPSAPAFPSSLRARQRPSSCATSNRQATRASSPSRSHTRSPRVRAASCSLVARAAALALCAAALVGPTVGHRPATATAPRRRAQVGAAPAPRGVAADGRDQLGTGRQPAGCRSAQAPPVRVRHPPNSRSPVRVKLLLREAMESIGRRRRQPAGQ